MRSASLAVVLALSAAACASQPKSFRADAYHHGLYGYLVDYESPGQLLDSEWKLENYQLDEKGQPDVTKVGPKYRYTLYADLDGDGTLEPSEELDFVDLRLVHRRTAAEIWLQTIPMSQTLAETDLAVLGKAYVNAVAGSGLLVERIGDAITAKKQTYATRIVEEKATSIDGAPAHRVTFEMASVDQLELDPKSRWQRVSVVLARPGFFWPPPDAKKLEQLFPVLMVAGYESQPDRFAENLPAFEGFVRRISFEPVEVADQVSRIHTCAPDARAIRAVVLREDALVVLSPDLDGAQTDCVKSALGDHSWPTLTLRRSFVFRRGRDSR